MTSAQPKADFLTTEWARYTQWADRLCGDKVLLPLDGGRIDWDLVDRDTVTPARLDEITEADLPRLGVLIDGFYRWMRTGDTITVCAAWREGTPELAQIEGHYCAEAMDLTQDVIAGRTTFDAVEATRRDMDYAALEGLQERHGGELRQRPHGGEWCLFGATVEGRVGQLDIGPDGKHRFWGATAKPTPAAANDNEPAAKSQPRARFTLTWFGEIADAVPKETFVKGVLGDGEFTVVSGLPGSGKSVILTDLACHVAAGMEWMGRRVRQGLVVYIAAERKALTERRMVAFRKRHAVPAHVPLLVLGGRIDLTSNTSDANALVQVIRDAAKKVGLPAVWIIIDTLTRTFGPGDQNLSKDMTRFIQSIDVLLETKAHVTIVHHTAWSGERGKGAIDLDGAVDASFLVKKDGGSHVLICDGTNDGEEGTVCRFRMEGVQVGVAEDGEPTTAPVVVPAEDLAEGLVAKLKGHNAKALEILTEACREGTKLAEDEWRAAFYAAYPGDKQHALKMRFQRARRALVEAGAVYHHDGEYWVPVDGTHGTCAANVPCAV